MNEEQNNPNITEKKENINVVLPTKNEKVRDNMKMFVFGLLGLIAVVLILAGGVGVYRVYAKVAMDNFSITVANVLRLPAMKVDGERVLYGDYTDYLKAVQTSANLDAQGGGQALTSEQISDRVLIWLADQIMVVKAAKVYGVTIEQKDLDEAKSQIMQNFKDTAAADVEINKRYGWNIETYMKKIVGTMILQNKLNEKIGLDQKGKEETGGQAQKILDQIKAGGNFAELAKQYGEDGTSANGGSLGWFGKGEMVPQFEAVVFALKKGELAPELVETEYGYHIVRLDDKKTEKVKDDKGKLVNKETVNASHILFRFPSLDKYLEQTAKQSKKIIYIKVHNPFTDATPVAAQQ